MEEPFLASRTPSTVIFALFVLLAIAAPLIAPQNPYDSLQIFGWEASSQPGTIGSGGYVYLLGTDGLGRDIASTILYGLRVSLIVSLVSTGIAGMIGLTAGVMSAYFGNKVDVVIMRTVDLFLSLLDLDRSDRRRYTRPWHRPYYTGSYRCPMGQLCACRPRCGAE